MGEKLRYDMILPNGEPLRFDMPGMTWDGEVPASYNPPTPMQQNDLSITITQAAEDAILAKITELRALIDSWAVSLTDDDRAAYFKLGDARMAFDQKCDNYLHQHPDLVPPGISLAEYDKDGAAAAAIKRILAKLTPLETRLTDTLIVAGADRMDADLAFYNYLEFAARTGAAGADDIHDDLKATFPGSRRRGPQPPPAPPTP